MDPTSNTFSSASTSREFPWRRALVRLALAGILFAAPLAACGADEPSVKAVEIAVESTTSSTTTTTTRPPATTSSTTTSTEPRETLPEQPPTPIAPPQDEYGDEPLLRIGSIEIPTLGVDSVLYQGIRLTTLDQGPGHWPGTALPGEVGNTVVAGHRTSHGRVFRDIDRLQAGDEIIFNTLEGRHVYRVTGVQIIEPYDVWIVDPTDFGRATIFACHPPGSTRQRIVAFADLVTD
jgi:sortase A